MFDVTDRISKKQKVDCISDYERRELDCWIAENIEQLDVQHDHAGIIVGSRIRLSDLAYRAFRRTHKNFVPSALSGPYPIALYSFSPHLALNVFQDTEYSEGWIFLREKDEWSGSNDGLHVTHCKSFALCLMLALQHEYNYQNQKEQDYEAHN